MAKKTNGELLALILADLDVILANLNATASSSKKRTPLDKAMGGTFNKPESGSKLDGYNLGMMSSALLNFSKSVKTVAKISDKDLNKLEDVFKTMSRIISTVQLDKTELKNFNEFIKTIILMNTSIEAITKNIFKNFALFSPAIAMIIGKRMGKFYATLMKSMKMSTLMSSIRGLTAANAFIFNKLSQSILSLLLMDIGKAIKNSIMLRALSRKGIHNLIMCLGEILNFVDLRLSRRKLIKFEQEMFMLRSLIKTLGTLNIAEVIALSAAGKLLNGKVGRNIGNFFAGFLKPFDHIKPKTVGKAVATLATIAAMFVTIVAIVAINAMIAEKYSWKTLGKAAVIILAELALTYGIIKVVSSRKFMRDVNKGLIGLVGVAAVILAVTVSLMLTVKIAKDYSFKDLALGALMLVTVLGVSWLIAKVAGSKKFEQTVAKSLFSLLGVVAVIGLISIVSLLFVATGKHAKNVMFGIGVTGLVIAGVLGILYLVSKATTKAWFQLGMVGLTEVAVAIAMISGTMLAFTLFAKLAGKLSWKAIGKASAIAGGVITCVTGVMIALGALMSTGVGAAMFEIGFVAFEQIAIAIASISGAMILFKKMVDTVNKLSTKDIDNAYKILAKGGNGHESMCSSIKKIIDALSDVSGKSALKSAYIAKTLTPVFKTISRFVDVVQKMAAMKIVDHYDDRGNPVYRRMEFSEFKLAALNLTEGFMYFLNGMNEFGNKANTEKMEEVIRIISKRQFRKVIDVIGRFVDIIQKMGNLLIVDYFTEKDGVSIPHYRKMTNKEFGEAAVALTNGFKTFLSTLSDNFLETSIIAIKSKFLIGQLFPTTLFGLVEKPGIGHLINALSSFTDIIIKMASAQIPIYNADGTIKSYLDLNGDTDYFSLAATRVSTAFSTFVTTLSESLDKNVAKKVGDLAKKLGKKGSLFQLMASIGQFMEPLIKMATGKIQIGDQTYDVNFTKINDAASKMALALKKFVTPLSVWKFDNKQLNTAVDAINKVLPLPNSIIENFSEEKQLQLASATEMLLSTVSSIKSTANMINKDTDTKRLNALKDYLSKAEKTYEVLTKDTWAKATTTISGLGEQFVKFNNLTIQIEAEQDRLMNGYKARFDDVTESAKKLTKSLITLHAAERALSTATSKSLYKNLEEMLDKQREVLQTAAKSYTDAAEDLRNAVKENAMQVQLVPGSLRAEIGNLKIDLQGDSERLMNSQTLTGSLQSNV